MQTLEKNILSIQALRGIAAILVVFCHSMQYISNFLPVQMERYVGYCFGNFGVDIFFVISGFIMVYISRNDFGQISAVGPFLLKRILRIFPMYWVTTLVVLIIIIPSGLYAQALLEKQQIIISSVKNMNYITENFLLIPPYYLSNNTTPIIPVAWTLFFEMFFYYIFGLLLMFNRKIYLPALCFIFGSLVLSNLYFLHFHITNKICHYINIYGNDIILEFIFGCFIAEQYLAGKMLTTNVAVSMVILSGLAIILSYHGTFFPISPSIQALQHGVPSAFIVFGILSLETNNAIKIPNFLIRLGDSSYSIYLTHLSIFLAILIALLKQTEKYIHLSGNLAVFISWIFCIFLGHLSFNYIEKPITKWLRRSTHKNKALLPSST